MKKTFNVRGTYPAACQRGYQESANWYKQKQKSLGKRFISKVRQKVNFIRQNPNAYAVRYDDTRCGPLDVFPYMIHYSVDEDIKLILISAVLHSGRDPRVWKER